MSNPIQSQLLRCSPHAYITVLNQEVLLWVPNQPSPIWKGSEAEISFWLEFTEPRQASEVIDGYDGQGRELLEETIRELVHYGALIEGSGSVWPFADALSRERAKHGRKREARLSHDVVPVAYEPMSSAECSVAIEQFADTDKHFERRHSVRSFDEQSPSMEQLLATVALTFRTRTGAYQRRSYPSGGAIHSLEAYVLTFAHVGQLQAGLHHYNSCKNRLDYLGCSDALTCAARTWSDQATGATNPTGLLLLCSRYLEVDQQYAHIAWSLVQREVGASLQAFHVAGIDTELGVCIIGNTSSEVQSTLLKFLRTDEETHPLVGAAVFGRNVQ